MDSEVYVWFEAVRLLRILVCQARVTGGVKPFPVEQQDVTHKGGSSKALNCHNMFGSSGSIRQHKLLAHEQQCFLTKRQDLWTWFACDLWPIHRCCGQEQYGSEETWILACRW